MAARTMTDMKSLSPNYLDGVLALQVLLAQDFPVSIYQRQILVADNSAEGRLVFAHGVPDSTVLTSAVTTQNKRMRRALLERKNVPVPKGANFSMGRGIALAKQYAKGLGYPVTVKPSKGDAGLWNFTNVRNVRELSAAIAKLKTPVHERKELFRAGYTPMELGIPGFEDGHQTVSKGYRFLVEQRVSGALIRFLISDGKVISAVQCFGSPLDGSLQRTQDVLTSIHPELIEAAENAGRALPGLSLAAIDVVVPNPEQSLRRQKHWVVDFYERPFLWVQAVSSPEQALKLSETIVQSHCATRGFPFNHAQQHATIDFTIHSLPSASGGKDELLKLAPAYGIDCEVREISDIEGYVRGSMSGGSFEVARLLNDLTNDEIPAVPAMMIAVKKQA